MSAVLEQSILSIPDPPSPPYGMAITNVESFWPFNNRSGQHSKAPRFYPTMKAARRAWEDHIHDLRILATASDPYDPEPLRYAECEFTGGMWGEWDVKSCENDI